MAALGRCGDAKFYDCAISASLPSGKRSLGRDELYLRESYGWNILGTAQVGTAQVGTAQVGTAQVGTAQVGTAQVGTAQLGTAQVGTAQVGTAQVGTAQVGFCLDGLYQRVFDGQRCRDKNYRIVNVLDFHVILL